MAHLGRHGPTAKVLLQFTNARCAILKLAAALTRGGHNPRGNMAHAHGRIGGVHALPAWTGGTKDVHLAVTRDFSRCLTRKRGILSICQVLFFHEPKTNTLAVSTGRTH